MLLDSCGSEKHFERILTDRELIIGSVDGTEVLAPATCGDVFGWVDPYLEEFDLTKKEAPTGETPVGIYRMKQDGTTGELFGRFCPDFAKIYLTQHQVKEFGRKFGLLIRNHKFQARFLLRPPGSTHFVVAAVSCFCGRGEPLEITFRPIEPVGGRNVLSVAHHQVFVVPEMP